ncbi:hypothetical protein OIA45_48690 (plasmid) [Streptomyces chartreusis]|uniref:hypothetical protein n=1 Tax=Streptomyces chartreusis TaxID=1969 RepID=UPI0037DD92C9|nr:hypothetical protein OIA45_48690 [Streptomyces chartreusis]
MPLESVEDGFNRWRARALEAELEVRRLQAEVEQLTEASRLFLNQRQEMAEERYAWQERGDRAEARARELESGRDAVLRETVERLSRVPLANVLTELRRMADEAQQQPDTETPWMSDGARIGRALIWSWAEVGRGEFARGYRAAQEEARRLLTGPTETDAPVQQPNACNRCGHFSCTGKGPCGVIMTTADRIVRPSCQCLGPAVMHAAGDGEG